MVNIRAALLQPIQSVCTFRKGETVYLILSEHTILGKYNITFQNGRFNFQKGDINCADLSYWRKVERESALRFGTWYGVVVSSGMVLLPR